MKKCLSTVISLTVIVASMVAFWSTHSVRASSTTVVISEFRTRGPLGGNDEFIELYNVSSSSVDISGWKISGSNNAGTTSTRVTIGSNVVLDPGCRFLATNSASSGYSGSVAGDQTYATGITDDGGLALLKTDNTIVDAVGMSAGSAYKEGTTLAPTTTNAERSYERKPGGGTDNSQDTDNNAADFLLNTGSSNPQNRNSTCTPPASDAAPSVSSSTPANGAANVPLQENIALTFSEPVNVAGTWFTIACATSGTHTATVTGGPTNFMLDPETDFANNEQCTVTVSAAQVTDQDVNDPPDNMSANYVFSFSTAIPKGTLTFIHDIQGSGATSTPGTFTVEAIVVGDYQTQGSGQLRGFFVQEEDGDADSNPATSEGIFVFCGGCPTPVKVGDKVRVTGASSEFFNMSQLTATTAGSVTVLSSDNPLPTPATITLPVPNVPNGDFAAATTAVNAYFESFEGMLVTFPETLSISEYFELARYGQLILTQGGRPRQYTDEHQPTASGFVDHQIDLARRTIILDDTDNIQNRPVTGVNTPYFYPVPGLSTTNFFRGGDTIANLTGVLHWSFAGQNGTDAWRIRPVTEKYGYAFSPANPRPAVPQVGGRLKVAGFNVLNYFLTIDTTSSDDVGICGASATLDCRGADSAQELSHQRTKMLAALQGLNADIFGITELENTPGVEPLADIVAGLPGYDYIRTGVIGGDAIKVGLIFRTATVRPVGEHAILDSSVDPRFIDTRNRPSLAQTFEEIATGARFTVVINHLKSKGSGCGAGDDDTTTGQGNCNLTRKQAAVALADWLATDPTRSGDPDVLLIGDFNSYAKEEPIVALENAGYINQVAAFAGAEAYSYLFDGQLGYLDHALSNPSLASQVIGVADWHVNADGVPLFDYNDDVLDAGEASFEQESSSLPLHEPNQFRTSDHDPVLIGLNLNAPPTVDGGGPYTVDEGGSVTVTAIGSDPNSGDTLTYAWDFDNDGSFETPGQTVTFSAATLGGPSSNTIKVRVTDNGGLSAIDEVTVDVKNAPPSVAAPSVTPEPSIKGATATVGAMFSDPAPNDAPFTCTVDYGDGSSPVTGTVSQNTCKGPSHTYANVGTYTVVVSVTDKDHGTGSNSAKHSVIFNFTGFLQPVDNLPVVNSVKAGQSVPIRFSLAGNQGLNIFAAGYPKSDVVACSAGSPGNAIEETLSAGSGGLSYDPTTDTYTYIWKTEKGWANTCRQLVVKLSEGTVHRANFTFLK
jgi:predicted extracellular nuclease